MKLSNQQIEAIINSIKSKEQKQIDVERKEHQSNPKFAKEAERIFVIIDKLPTSIKSHMYSDLKSVSNITKVLAGDFEPKTKLSSSSDLRNKLILTSIDASSLEELKNKLDIEF